MPFCYLCLFGCAMGAAFCVRCWRVVLKTFKVSSFQRFSCVCLCVWVFVFLVAPILGKLFWRVVRNLGMPCCWKDCPPGDRNLGMPFVVEILLACRRELRKDFVLAWFANCSDFWLCKLASGKRNAPHIESIVRMRMLTCSSELRSALLLRDLQACCLKFTIAALQMLKSLCPVDCKL